MSQPDPIVPIDSPPPSERPPEQEPDPRTRLLELAAQLRRHPDRRRMLAYLQLRKAVSGRQ